VLREWEACSSRSLSEDVTSEERSPPLQSFWSDEKRSAALPGRRPSPRAGTLLGGGPELPIGHRLRLEPPTSAACTCSILRGEVIRRDRHEGHRGGIPAEMKPVDEDTIQQAVCWVALEAYPAAGELPFAGTCSSSTNRKRCARRCSGI